MKNKIISIFVLLFFATLLSAQKDVEIDYKALSKLPDFSKADVKKVKEADKIYFGDSKHSYKEALAIYLEVYSEFLGHDPLDWRMAICYLHSEDKAAAINHILRCDESVSNLYYFYLGKAYHFDGQFEKAKDSYGQFAEEFAEDDYKMFFATFEVKAKDYEFAEVMQDLQNACDVGINTTIDTINIEFENIKVINSVKDELYPILHPDGALVYSSNKSTVPKVETSNFKIYDAACDTMLIIGFPKLSNKYPQDEEDNLIALPYYEYAEGLLYQSMKSDGGDVMMTYKKGSKIKGDAIPKINSSSKEGAACFVGDGIIVFSSDRASKENMNDLYITFKSSAGKWSKPVAVGGSINTSANEEVVTYYNEELYYISNSIGGIGGYDIYKVPYLGENNWGQIKNLGYPINTADNDLGYFPVDDYNAFYSGVRPGGVGGVDIYKVMFDSLSIIDTTIVDTLTVDSVNLDIMQEDTMLSVSDSIVVDSLVVDSIPLILEEDSLPILTEPLDSSALELIIDEGESVDESVEVSDSILIN